MFYLQIEILLEETDFGQELNTFDFPRNKAWWILYWWLGDISGWIGRATIFTYRWVNKLNNYITG